jgi:hypothetical protein
VIDWLESLVARDEDQLEQHRAVVASLVDRSSNDLRRIESAVRACRDENWAILAAAILCGAVPDYLKSFVPPRHYVVFVQGPGESLTEDDLARLWGHAIRRRLFNPPNAPPGAICSPGQNVVGPAYTYAELQAFKAGGVGVRLTALARRVLGRDAVPALDAMQMVSAPRLPSAQIPADPRLAAVQLVRTLVARFAWVAPSFSVVLTATTPVIWGW